MEVEVLKGVVSRPFEPNLTLTAEEAVYTGSVIPLDGQAEVKVTTTRIEAEVIDRTGWHARAWRELPPGTIGEPSLVFRPTTPGKLARPEHYGTIVTQAGWNADKVLYFGYREHNGLGGNEATYRFQLFKLRVDGSALGSPVVGIRSIYRRGGFGAGGKIDDHFVVVRRLSADEADIESEFLAVTYDCIPDELTQDAVWHTLNFLAGNTVQPLATEHLAENGEIVYTERRIGVDSRDTSTLLPLHVRRLRKTRRRRLRDVGDRYTKAAGQGLSNRHHPLPSPHGCRRGGRRGGATLGSCHPHRDRSLGPGLRQGAMAGG